MSNKKRLLLALLALAIIGLVLYSFRPTPVAVSVAAIERGPMQVTIEQEGWTRVRDRFDVTAPVAGYLARVSLEVGDSVSAGDTITELRPSPPPLLDRRSLAQAEAAVTEAEAAYRFARKELARARSLRQTRDIAETAVNEAEARAAQALANLRAARAVLEYSGGDADGGELESVPLTAPVTGQILAIRQKSAGLVAAGTPIATVGNAGALEAAIDVLSADAVQLKPGMRVLLDRWGGDSVLKGVVKTIEPAAFTKVSALGVEEQRVWVVVDITSPKAEWEKLGDLYRVEASFITWAEEDVLKAPASALFRDGDGWAVFVVEDESAVKRSVVPGHRAELVVEIQEGLTAGEVVVTHPGNELTDGAEVEVRGT